MSNHFYDIKSVLFGVAVGDALGVPVEFRSRDFLKADPVTSMRAMGVHQQPAGTFSDDGSLTFCVAESLTNGYDLRDMGNKIASWYNDGYWTAHGHVFDIGLATRDAIYNLQNGRPPELCGSDDERSNGNGSLMRISPLVFYLRHKSIAERYAITKQVSSITHRHIRSIVGCFYYVEFMRLLLEGKSKADVYCELQQTVTGFLTYEGVDSAEIKLYDALLNKNIAEFPEEKISGSGYVVRSLETSIWCLMTTDTYSQAVLKAVNLGDDTDTTGAITGGLAGLLYGYDQIPADWASQIARKEDIENLAERLAATLTV